MSIFLYGDDSGRLLSHNPSTKETKVVLANLHFPNGIAISRDKSYLLICETLKQRYIISTVFDISEFYWAVYSNSHRNVFFFHRILRYWIQGPKTGIVEEFALLPGFPDNIRLTERDDFWVAIHAQTNWIMRLPILVRRALLNLTLPLPRWYFNMARKQAMGMVVRLNSKGETVEVLEDRQGKLAMLLSSVEEKDGVLWLGSVVLPRIVKYRLEQD